ncbi:hypothetical protein ABZP36_000395 [Zizania latifolia]
MGLDVGEIGVGADLSLDLKMFAAKSVGCVRDSPASAMDDCIRRLEEERGKIEVFRRELPLSVRLLVDLIDVMKEEVDKKKGDHKEEEADDAGDARDKSNWMSTAQLWTGNSGRDGADSKKQDKGKISSEGKSHGGGGAFVPFKTVGSGAPAFARPRPSLIRREDMTYDVRTSGLSLLLPPAAADESRRQVMGFAQAAARAAATAPSGPSLSLQVQSQPAKQQQQQQPRKARRCWSPELHRKFVSSLQQLGGPQVATPKQIRELMKMDSLTNDEVKSHLQKYRLHNARRVPSSTIMNQPIVLMGGLWIPQEQSSSQSGSPKGPLHFSASAIAGSSAVTVSCEEEDGSRSETYGWK